MEIICHLADLLADRKEEILAANKVDMDKAVTEGTINKKGFIVLSVGFERRKNQTVLF